MLLAQIDIGNIFTNLFSNMNWGQIALLLFVGYMFLTGKLKLSDLLNLLKPGPTPTPTPNPNPGPVPTPSPNTPIADLITQILPILLPILLKAKVQNNKQLEEATTTLLKEAVAPPHS